LARKSGHSWMTGGHPAFSMFRGMELIIVEEVLQVVYISFG
jgi:hypothetical protein